MKLLTYTEIVPYLLEGKPVKLHGSKEYWIFDKDKNKMFIHFEDGRVEEPKDICFTFCNTWEIATVENCITLKRELDKEQNKKEVNFTIADVDMLPIRNRFTPVVVIRYNEDNSLKVLTLDDFIELVGDRLTAFKMTDDFIKSKIPVEIAEDFDKISKQIADKIIKRKTSYR